MLGSLPTTLVRLSGHRMMGPHKNGREGLRDRDQLPSTCLLTGPGFLDSFPALTVMLPCSPWLRRKPRAASCVRGFDEPLVV